MGKGEAYCCRGSVWEGRSLINFRCFSVRVAETSRTVLESLHKAFMSGHRGAQEKPPW